MERFAQNAARILSSVLDAPVAPESLDVPPDPKLGDFAFACFSLAKEFRKAPPQIATEILGRLRKKASLREDAPVVVDGVQIQATGPYLNFSFPTQSILKELLSDILKGKDLGEYGASTTQRGTWVLEYSSPNVAKPFQVYHLRPTALGAALARIGKFRGFQVISLNHLGDWGTQYGKLSVALKRHAQDLPAEPKIEDLVRLYVQFHEEAKADPALEDEAREAFLKLEKGDPELTALWKKCVDISLKEFRRIYARLGVEFDYIWGESHYKDFLQPLLKDLKAKGLLQESQGAKVVFLEDENGAGLPPCILEKKDGATIYATRDIAAAIYRYEKFKFDRMTYIVGGEQRLHFQQVFAVLKKAGYAWVKNCEHVPTGIYRFKGSGKMSTRKGKFVTLEEALEAAKERVREIIRERAQDHQIEDIEDTVEKVAVGAVVFFDLSTDPSRDVDFNLERIVDFEGETGPYLQYAHTRCLSIIRKARETGELSGEMPGFHPVLIAELKKPEEIRLVKTLGQFPSQLERSLNFRKANQLANYLIDITKEFNAFYRECQVLGQSAELTRARLMLVEATRRILGRGLTLLGIPLPQRM